MGKTRSRATRALVAASATALLVLSTAGGAAALGEDDGTVWCQHQVQKTRAYATGTVHHEPAPSGSKTVYHNGWEVSYASASAMGGGHWVVWTSGSVSPTSTYAYCVG